MPVFHTKTIKSILEPVAQQVSKLVILHEEAEDGNAMPDLSRPVQVVKMAVDNLIKVGYETTNSSNDTQLKEDMPPALKRVEDSCGALLQASNIINSDPYSSIARAKLIEGSRGILQGTSALLVAFDESEVRKIIRVCQHVLEYLSIVEVIDNLEDLVTFVKNLSPVLTRMTKEVDVREKELTHQVHREYLQRSLEQVKHLTPSLITSVKIYVTSKNHQDGGSLDDALSSRNYVTEKLTNEVHEIIRVLQLQTYDEVGWEGDDVMAVKKAQNAMDHKMKLAHDWLSDPSSAVGLSGDHAARSILHDADIIISKCAEDADDEVIEEVAAIKKTASNIASMMDALSELKQHGDGNSTQALSLARGIEEGLKEVQSRCSKVVQATDRLKSRDTAHTMAGKLKQAQQWLSNRNKQFTPAGHQAVKQLAEDGMRIAGNMGAGKEELEQLCTQVQMLVDQLAHASSSNQGDSPQAKQTAITLSHKLKNLKQKLQDSVVAMVAEDFMDISTPLKALSEAAVVSLEEPKREENFEEKALNFSNNTERLVSTARQLARVAVCGNRRVVEALSAEAQMLEDLLPQLVKAGRMLLHNPSNQVLQEHYDVLKGHAAEGLERLRCLADEAIDAESFISCNETGMRKDTERAEESLKADDRLSFVNHTSRVARRAHRILQVAQSEAENSDDPRYVDVINHASTQLRNNIAPMIQEAKFTAQNPHNATNTNMWRSANNKLLDRVGEVRNAVTDREYGRDFPDVAGLNISKDSRSSSNSNHQQHYNHQQQYNKNQHNNHNTYDNQLHNSHNAYNNQQLNKHYPNTPSSPTSSSPHSFQYSRDEDYYRGYNNENPPPRPPLPLDTAPPRPPPPETDDEFEVSFPSPQTNQPIMMAAHALHNDVKQWSSRDNDLIAAAKKMALLMAKLSMLVRGEGGGKKDLIACAKAVAQASDEVTELAKKLAQECTDKRMRMHLLQVCERIPTIGTQLKILSTVKATMIGAQGSEEDEEATEMLVGNAQNLMQAVRETLVCAEAASIKIRIDSGYSIKWLRKRPWYA